MIDKIVDFLLSPASMLLGMVICGVSNHFKSQFRRRRVLEGWRRALETSLGRPLPRESKSGLATLAERWLPWVKRLLFLLEVAACLSLPVLLVWYFMGDEGARALIGCYVLILLGHFTVAEFCSDIEW